MTTKEKIEVMQAFVDGKQIEVTDYWTDEWGCEVFPQWNWDKYKYRVKSIPKYVPFTFEDAEFLVGRSVRYKIKEAISTIVTVSAYQVVVGIYSISFECLLDEFEFLNKTPCGKLV